MGIPSYFSYVIKEHRKILKKLQNINYHNLYLDSNSIIYDALKDLVFTNKEEYENAIILKVFEKINYLITTTKPNKVLIAFDGIAPFGKLNQQKTRRYKSWIVNELLDNTVKWDKCAITPGTDFMEKLNVRIKEYYTTHLSGLEIIISGSDEPGEGEHKIFEYIRNNKEYHQNTQTIIYGLDSDLIMLTLNHLYISPNLFLFRETPEFIKSIDKSLDPNSYYIMDIAEMSELIENLISKDGSNSSRKDYVCDYIFMCFFVGNDFIPHHPAINIRTNGIEQLIDAYRAVLKPNEHFTNGSVIHWKNVKTFIRYLCDVERDYICDHISWKEILSEKINKRHRKQDMEEKLNMVPCIDISTEQYINPEIYGWQKRYYKKIFHFTKTQERMKEVSINYLKALEWTMKYYSIGCVNWEFYYKYNHAPLFEDLVNYIPHFDQHLIEHKPKKVAHPLVQLSFVLSKKSLHLLPKDIQNMLLENYPSYYETNYELEWSFCRYFWECHVLFPEIDTKKLEVSILKHLPA